MRKLALLLALAACGDPAAPLDFTGEFVVSTIDGAPPPAPYNPASHVSIMAARLIVHSPDTLRLLMQLGEPGTMPVSWSGMELRYGYDRQGDSLVINLPSGSGGRVLSDRVRLHVLIPGPPSVGFVSQPFSFTFVPAD